MRWYNGAAKQLFSANRKENQMTMTATPIAPAAQRAATKMKYPSFVGGRKIEFVEKPVSQPGSGELLIRVHANALCGSERPQWVEGAPVTPGHEAAGVVEAAGPGTHTAVGTPGVVFLMDFCGKCRSCRLGLTNQCLAKRADMGFNKDGGYGPYELIHENIFFPTNSELTPTEATLLLDIMGTNGHALERCRMIRPDIESVLVMGAGPIGLGLLVMAKIVLGHNTPVAIADISPYRLKLAEQLGGLPVDVKNASLDEGLKRHNLSPVDIAVDTSGKQVARESALRATAQRGAVICVGHGEGIAVKVSPDIIAAERSIVGSEYFRYNELAGNLQLLRQHKSYLSQIITHRFGVGDIQHAFELFFGGETGKVIIEQ
jgi:threonine 3-dehydrogenase